MRKLKQEKEKRNIVLQRQKIKTSRKMNLTNKKY